ncbi:MFS transporter [Notoacmeibacter sp. MSK16QG-6]|uniref:MFS transporter n=1 Tax=Notoacmeibacter sp. MSK16QG-6 TaxID=2957982 RepID=UPI0020A1FC10|nr:MFS transporter [Notoacmeibacter sp. MSK16QG-6]MCP1199229.1 MFS transporter [Notoacmeibacter sp. MSK16QG-6]
MADLDADDSEIRPTRPHGPEDRFAAFRYRAYTLYWLSRFFSTFATQIFIVALGWQVYDITRDPLDLGLIGLTQFLPALLLVLVTGSAADRFGRRRIMAISAAVEAAIAAALLAYTLTNPTVVWPVFALLVIFGSARAFYSPASSALVANLVPADTFANAVSWNASAWQTATIVGPVLGGLLYGAGATVAYGVATILFIAGAFLVISISQPAQQIERERISVRTVLAGFDYIRREKVVFGAISLDLFAVLLGGAVALMPVYARDILTVGPLGLGMLRAAPGIGALAMAFWLARYPIRAHAGVIMLGTVALFGLFTVVFGFSTLAWLSIAALVVMGAADMVSVVIRETLIQLWTPDDLRGRVNAVNQVFLGASNELGEFRAGTMAYLIGAVPAVVLGGFAAMGCAGLWAWLFPQLARVQHLDSRH